MNIKLFPIFSPATVKRATVIILVLVFFGQTC